MAQRSLSDGAVVSLLDAWQLPQQEVHAVFPSPRLVPAKVRQFSSWMQGQFGSEGWKRGEG